MKSLHTTEVTHTCCWEVHWGRTVCRFCPPCPCSKSQGKHHMPCSPTWVIITWNYHHCHHVPAQVTQNIRYLMSVEEENHVCLHVSLSQELNCSFIQRSFRRTPTTHLWQVISSCPPVHSRCCPIPPVLCFLPKENENLNAHLKSFVVCRSKKQRRHKPKNRIEE